MIITPYHPSQEHIQSLATGLSHRSGNVLSGTFHDVWLIKYKLMESCKRIVCIIISLIDMIRKSIFETFMCPIIPLQNIHKKNHVVRLQRPVPEMREYFPVWFFM